MSLIDMIKDIVNGDNDWSYNSHRIIDITPTKEDFENTIKNYDDFQWKQSEEGRITKEEYWSDLYNFLAENGVPKSEVNNYRWIPISDNGEYTGIFCFILIDIRGEEPEPVLSVESYGIIGIKLKRLCLNKVLIEYLR